MAKDAVMFSPLVILQDDHHLGSCNQILPKPSALHLRAVGIRELPLLQIRLPSPWVHSLPMPSTC